jgi:hypothetical protein
MTSDWYPDYPDRNCKKRAGKDSGNFTLYFMTSCKVLNYPDRNCRNEEVKTHGTSPYTS